MVRAPGRLAMSPSCLPCTARSARPRGPARSPKTASWWVLLILLLALLAPVASLAQEETATLSGRVLDATDDAPVGFASVVVENADSGERLTGTLTGEDGRFLVQGLAGNRTRSARHDPSFNPG